MKKWTLSFLGKTHNFSGIEGGEKVLKIHCLILILNKKIRCSSGNLKICSVSTYFYIQNYFLAHVKIKGKFLSQMLFKNVAIIIVILFFY